MFGAATVAFCLLFFFSVVIGPTPISSRDLLHSILPALVAGDDLPRWQETILLQVRLPRVCVGALVGASLAVCGGVMQGLFRNPLASPDILGVSTGAGLGASIAIFLGLAAIHVWALTLFAVGGSLIALGLLYVIALRDRSVSLAMLIMAGVAIDALGGAIRSFLLSIALENYEIGNAIVYWSLGSLDGRSWTQVVFLAPIFALAGLVIARHCRALDVLQLGESHAIAVGVDTERVRLELICAAAALSGAAVAASGGIGFIGLMAPHIVRLCVGAHHRLLLPVSAVGGAGALIGADLLLRVVFERHNIPIGALTAALGAPFFLYLMLRQRQHDRP